MGHQLSRYGPSPLSMGIYIDMVRLSKYGGNIWNILRDPYTSSATIASERSRNFREPP